MQFQTRTLRIPIAEVDGNKNDFYNDLRSSLQLSVKSMNYLYGCYLSDDKDIFDKNKWRVNPKTGKSTLPLLPEWILKGFGYSKINSFSQELLVLLLLFQEKQNKNIVVIVGTLLLERKVCQPNVMEIGHY